MFLEKPQFPLWLRPFLLAGGIGMAVPTAAVAQISEAPLSPLSGPRGHTMFAEISPDQSGVVTENNYADPNMWGERYQEFALGSFGTGVAIGDYDLDGRPDLFVVSKTESCRLFRNLGDWRFADVTEKAGLGAGSTSGGWASRLKGLVGLAEESGDSVEAWKQGATFADVDNDGWLDLYVCRFGKPNWLYINQGDGSFLEEAAARGLAVVDASGMAAFCDYDRDGWLDVYIQTNMFDSTKNPEGQRDFLFRNTGGGHFEDVTERAGIAGENLAHSATWWDHDNDGWPDLYVANDFGPPDSLYRNNRDGTFTNRIHEAVPVMPYSAMGADQGDINNDGLIDFLVADMATTTHEKDQRGMASSRELSRPDSDSATLAPQVLRNVLLLNTDTGRFQEAAFIAGLDATDWTWSIRFEDLDNDGRLDLHVTNGMNREYQNADLRQRIILAESLTERMALMRKSPVLAEPNLAFRNDGDLRFESVGAAWGLDQTGVSFGAAFGDLDGDGDLDVAYTNYQAGVTLLRNDSDSGHRVILELRGRVSNWFGVGASARIETDSGIQVRQLVLARGYLSNSEPILHFGLGEDERINRLTVSWPSGHTQSFGNLPVDRRFTITEPSTPAKPAVARMEADTHEVLFREVGKSVGLDVTTREGVIAGGYEQPLIPVRFSRRGPALAVGDLDGDHVDDIVVGGTAEDPPRILLADGSGGFKASEAAFLGSPVTVDDGPILIFDFDGDGANDLLATRAGAGMPAGARDYQPGLFLNDGSGRFRPAPEDTLPALNHSAGAVAAVDLDRDGALDLFLGGRVLPGQYPLAPSSALLLNRGGKFEDVTDSLAPGLREVGMVSSAMWSDVDDDGWLDLLLALEWGGVGYWRNDAGCGFEDRSEQAGFAAAGNGWWTSLAAADFNGDGRLDYAAGNVGLNTQYSADPGSPALVYYGAFRGRGTNQLVEAYYEGDRLYPRRTSKSLSAQIPALKRRYKRNDDYAHATLDEILGAEKLAAAQRFEADEFHSGVFLSQPDGTFRFEPLPRIAQISPLQGMVAGDFDGDGSADIYAVQNSHAPIPFVGRFTGGLSQLLLGNGKGAFAPVSPQVSGLVVPGDGKALAIVDAGQDGTPDFVISRNNSTTMLFRNEAPAGRHFLQVQLQGHVGNPTAIGARVSLALSDGTGQVCEVSAGSGYYTQSTASCFFGFADPIRAERLSVRWPSGTVTEHEVTAGRRTIQIAAPQQ